MASRAVGQPPLLPKRLVLTPPKWPASSGASGGPAGSFEKCSSALAMRSSPAPGERGTWAGRFVAQRGHDDHLRLWRPRRTRRPRLEPERAGQLRRLGARHEVKCEDLRTHARHGVNTHLRGCVSSTSKWPEMAQARGGRLHARMWQNYVQECNAKPIASKSRQ